MDEIYDSFEEEKLSDIWLHTKFEEGAIDLQSDVVRKGNQAVKITINKGDKKEGNTERDELLERKELGPREGKVYNYSFSISIFKFF